MHHFQSAHHIRRSHEIALAHAQIVAAFRRGEAVAIAAFYAQDAAIIPTSSTFVVGVSAITRFWQSFLDLGGTDLSAVTIELEDCGPYTSEIGQYTLIGQYGPRRPLGVGRYLLVWTLEQGKWLIHRQIWNRKL